MDLGERILVQNELPPEAAGQHLDREIVAGRAQPSRDEHDVGPADGAQEGVGHLLGIVAHGRVPIGLDVQ